MASTRILHRCNHCDKPFVATDSTWFINDPGIDCHACEDGEIGQKTEMDLPDDEDDE